MTALLAPVRALDRMSMYRAVVLGLGALLLCAWVIALTDPQFAVTGPGLALSVLISCVVSFAVTYLGAAIVRVPPGTSSWLVTALIIVFLFPGVTDMASAGAVAIAAAIASASKYVVALRGRHIVNPAALGAVVCWVVASVLALQGTTVPAVSFATWWVASSQMLIPMGIIAALVVLKLREVPMVAAFLVVAVITHAVVGSGLDMWRSSPTLFLAAFMLTEPLTSPSVRWAKLAYGAMVGVLMYSGWHVQLTDSFRIEFVPEIALTIGCVFAFVANRQWRRPALAVREVSQIAPDTYRVIADGAVRFRPGQWALVSRPQWVWAQKGLAEQGLAQRGLARDGKGSRRVLSVASSPSSSYTEFGFTVAGEPSAFKRGLIDSVAGQRIYLDEVGGDFVLPRGDRPVVLIAGGIGITPFRSMLDAALDAGRDLSHVSVLHAVRDADREIYRDVLDAAREAGATVHVVRAATVSESDIAAVDRDGAHYYLSGPPAMLQALRPLLFAADPSLRWQRWRVHTDRFTGY